VKQHMLIIALLLVSLLIATPVAAEPGRGASISSGAIVYPAGHYFAGQRVPNGPDAYGFNYTARRFDGWFVNSYLGFWGLPPYDGDYEAYIAANPDAAALGDPADPSSFWALKDLWLEIRWNEAYRSRTDHDGDGWFDRHWGSDTYQGSDAWYTNRVRGVYAGQEMRTYSKVAAAPANAVLTDGFWYTDEGEEFGYAVDDAAIGMAGVYDWQEGVGVLYEGVGYERSSKKHNGRGMAFGKSSWRNAY